LDDVKRIIKSFQKTDKLKFIALVFAGSNLDLNAIDRELLTQINGLEFRSIKLTSNCTLEDMYLCGDERDASNSIVPGATALTELILFDCKMADIDVRRLADFFPA
jgi:predicted transcriptional regulator